MTEEKKQKLMDMLADDFISNLIEMECNGKEWETIDNLLHDYAKENGIDYKDIRRQFGNGLKAIGLC